jgi:hypothetical protein
MKVHGDNIFTISTDSNFGKMSFLLNPFVLGAGADLGVCGWGAYTSPPITTNLLVHVDGDVEVFNDAGVTCASNDDFIRQWNDGHTTGNDLDQPTGSSQLKYKTNLLNNRNGVEALSNRDMLLTSTLALSGCTVYCVGKKATTSDQMTPCGDSGNGSIGLNWTDNLTYLFDGSNFVAVNTGHFTSWGVRAFVWDYGNTFEVYEDGVSLGSVSATSVGTITIDRLFSRGNGSSGTKNWMENMIYSDVHNSTQIGQISDYLNDKYSIY